MKEKTFKNRFTAQILAAAVNLKTAFKLKVRPEHLKKIDFSYSTQKIGVKFNNKIRNIFRFKWLNRL